MNSPDKAPQAIRIRCRFAKLQVRWDTYEKVLGEFESRTN